MKIYYIATYFVINDWLNLLCQRLVPVYRLVFKKPLWLFQYTNEMQYNKMIRDKNAWVKLWVWILAFTVTLGKLLGLQTSETRGTVQLSLGPDARFVKRNKELLFYIKFLGCWYAAKANWYMLYESHRYGR